MPQSCRACSLSCWPGVQMNVGSSKLDRYTAISSCSQEHCAVAMHANPPLSVNQLFCSSIACCLLCSPSLTISSSQADIPLVPEMPYPRGQQRNAVLLTAVCSV